MFAAFQYVGGRRGAIQVWDDRSNSAYMASRICSLPHRGIGSGRGKTALPRRNVGRKRQHDVEIVDTVLYTCRYHEPGAIRAVANDNHDTNSTILDQRNLQVM